MTPNKITIHCSATPNLQEYDIEKIRKYHKSKGWSDTGYHYVIQPSGEIQTGRPLNVQGAHVKGHNENNIGICLIGTDLYTKPQLVALRYKIDGIRITYDIPEHEIYCHYEFDSAQKQKKTCPNIRIADFIVWYCLHDIKAIQKYIS